MKKLLITFLFLFSTNAYCDWFKVTESDTAITFIDDSKITKKDKFIRAWTLTNFLNPVKFDDGTIYQSYVSFMEFDCREDKSRILSSTVYKDEMGKGKTLFTSNEVSKWNFSPPKSVGDFLIQFACGFK